MAKTLVIGSSGQLGTCLKTLVANHKIKDFFFPEESMANILDKNTLAKLFEEFRPEYVINCAAYTAVDKAEDEVELATAVNVEGAENLAELCKIYQSILIHISTDFVFEGNVVKLLKEFDVAKPISVYGDTKLQSELKITKQLLQYYILRTSWLYSEFGNNFTKTMLKLGAEREELNVIADQIGTPTYAIDLANMILTIISSGKKAYGIYHYSNEGVTSWYDFAKAIFQLSDMTIKLNPIPTSAYPTKAKRPHFSVMDKTKIKETFNIEIPYWRDSLEVCISTLKSNS